MTKVRLLLLAAVVMSAAVGVFTVEASPPLQDGNFLLVDLEAYWTLDEPSGTRYDSTANGHNATVVSGSVGADTGKVHDAADFAPQTGQLDMVSGPDWDTVFSGEEPDFTIALWAYLNELPGETEAWQLFGNQNQAGWDVTVGVYPGPAHFYLSKKAFDEPHTAAQVNAYDLEAEHWYFIVAWHDSESDTLNIQIDNGTPESVATEGGVSDFGGNYLMGLLPGQPTYLDGLVDEAGVWSRVLSEEERAYLWNVGNGCTYPFDDCTSATVGASILELGPIADATIRADFPETNYGLDDELWVGDAWPQNPLVLEEARTVMNFDWSAIPPGSQVISATLQLTLIGAHWDPNFMTVQGATLLQSFSETNVTWEQADPIVQGIPQFSPWNTPGAGAPDSRRPISFSETVAVLDSDLPSVYYFNVTSDVRKFVTGEYGGTGFVLSDQTLTSDQRRQFASSENAVSGNRPVLHVRYVEAPRETANWLDDGGFEKPATGLSNWIKLGSPQGNQRINEAVPGDPYNIGLADCGAQYHTIDGEGISQRFYWPGGTAYFRVALRAQDIGGAFPTIRAWKTTGGGVVYPIQLLNGVFLQYSGDEWQIYEIAADMFSGYYDLVISDESDPEGGNGVSDFQVDDVTISLNGYMRMCDPDTGATATPFPSPTPTSTRTVAPTPTGTLTPSLTPSRTSSPTPGAATAFSNCDFENGSAGWFGNDYFIALAGGPVGPQFVQIDSGGYVNQPFTWNGGTAYFTFYVGPGSSGQVVARRTNNQASYQVWSGTGGSGWGLIQRSLFLPAGQYVFEARGSINFLQLDGVMVAANGYLYCSSGTVAASPTPGPTSFISPTPTRTNTPGPSPTPTKSPTPQPTRTPFPTNTPQPTHTPAPTVTAAPTDTQTGPEQTATAQGTLVPTYTPYPTYTPAPTGTPVVEVPQQPEAGCNADCIRPQGIHMANPGAWIEFIACRGQSWVTWCPENTEQVVSWMDVADEHEPWGTLREVIDTLTLVRVVVQGLGWDNTGSGCNDMTVNLGAIFGSARGVLAGDLEFEPGQPIQASCSFLLSAALGEGIASGVCGLRGLLCNTGIMPWLQWLVDSGVMALFAIYLKLNWIDKATQS